MPAVVPQRVHSSAVLARRRAYSEAGKMILLLSDNDVLEMIALKESGDNPFKVIERQLEDFLGTLVAYRAG
jgi:hypothetical protein